MTCLLRSPPCCCAVALLLLILPLLHAASRSRKVKISDMKQRYFARRLVSVRRYLPV